MMERALRFAPHVAWQVVGGETVIVDLRNGVAMGLNGSGGTIWKHIGSTSEDAIAQQVADEFDLDLETARSDVEEFVRELLERELIEVSDA